MLAETIKSARRRKGLSQEKLAKLAGLSRQHISAIERGANVSIEVVQRIAAVLELETIPLGLTSLKVRSTMDSSEREDQVRRAIRSAANALADAERLFEAVDRGSPPLLAPNSEIDRAKSDKLSAESVLQPRNADALSLETIIKMIDLVNGVVETSPRYAVELSSMAIDLAALLESSEDRAVLAIVIGSAWREKAFALMRLGRYSETFDALNNADTFYRKGNAEQVRFGDVDYIRATALREIDRLPEALATVRKAVERFSTFDDSRRIENAQILEGIIALKLGRMEEARDISLDLIAKLEAKGDQYRLAMLYSNIGYCLTQLGDYASAESYLLRSIRLARGLKHEATRIRARWALAMLRVAQGAFDVALPELQSVQQEWQQYGDAIDAALAALDRIDVLLALGRAQDVRGSITELVNVLAREGHNTGALTALAFLRESAVQGTVTPAIVQRVRSAIQTALSIDRPTT